MAIERILMTGFEPFGGEAVNPSWEVARALHGQSRGGAQITAVQLPCVFAQSLLALRQAIRRHRPQLVLCLGLAGNRSAISLERVAVNLCDARIADNAGAMPAGTPVVAGGPAACFTRLPVKALVQRLRHAGLPAELSLSAGSFVCNQVFYGLMQALRRHLNSGDEEAGFPRDVMELQAYLGDGSPGQAVRAIPGTGTHVPIWLLGSSLYSAQLAAHLGLPFAFASHFAPEMLLQALAIYRSTYRPSAAWPKPYAMVGVNVVAAETDEEAAYWFTSLQQRFLGMQRGRRGPLPRPIAPEVMETLWSPQEKAGVQRMLAAAAVGSAHSVSQQLAALVEQTGADELIVAGAIHSHSARLRSYARLAEQVIPQLADTAV
jgi:pyroglutamyl-peptidase I